MSFDNLERVKTDRKNEIKKMQDLVEKINTATKAYDEGHPIMSDKEWDDLYFALVKLEFELGIILPESPTQKISYKVVNQLRKVKHNHPMLSLNKTKDLSEIMSFLNYSINLGLSKEPFIAMCKMDGLTCSLSYKNGFLVSAETRGDGLIGEDILHNAMIIPSIPKFINYYDDLIVDGEIICPYNKFKQFSEEYKNPRNFASGSIRLLDSKECSTRCLKFVAWDVIKGLDKHISHFYKKNNEILADERNWYESSDNIYLHNKLRDLAQLGFITVPFIGDIYSVNDFESLIEKLKNKAQEYSYPIDGIVFKFDDIEYGKSLGSTAHHFKNAMAFKFYDEVYQTIVRDVEWTIGRTGVLTPVAILDPIEIDGTVVTRASLHNFGIMYNELHLKYKGQKADVFKANMIIPQISKVYPAEDTTELLEPPTVCPICGGSVSVLNNNGVKTLVCDNPNCDGKFINRLDHFAGKKGLDIKGLSKATLEKLIDWGWINSLEDLFYLKTYRKDWINKSGFGEKSVDKILNAIEESKNCNLSSFISAIGIPLIGHTIAKDLVKYIDSYDDFRDKINNGYDFSIIPNFGEIKANAILNFNYSSADAIYPLLNITKDNIANTDLSLKDKIFVITGKLKHFKNRDELIKVIEERGGKVTGSVSAKTDYLINNDNTSNSIKNNSAKKLNIPIITEDDLVNML